MRFISLVAILGLASCTLAAYPQKTNSLYNAFGSCISKVNSDIQCVTTVRDGLEQLSDYIQQLRDIKTNMGKLDAGFRTFSTVLSIAKYIPKVGAAINALKLTVDAIKPVFNAAYRQVRAVDAKIYPLKPRVDDGKNKCDQAITYLNKVKTACTRGQSAVGAARTCVNAMANGNIKTSLQNSLESMGNSFSGLVNAMNNALGNVGNACNAVKRITDIIISWPNFDVIDDAMDAMYKALKPILDFFQDLQGVLNRRLCMKNPLEFTRETVEKPREAAENVKEAVINRERLEELEEIKEGVFGGWGKRKRSLSRRSSTEFEEFTSALERRALISLSEKAANNFLSVEKRGDICFSIKDILDGIDSIFKPIIDLANKAISDLLKAIPGLTLPGLPDFTRLLDLNLNFNLPTINFGIDLSQFNIFGNLNFNCGLSVRNVCAAGTGNLNIDCSATGKRELLTSL